MLTSEETLEMKRLENEIFTLLAKGVVGYGNPDRDIPIMQEKAKRHTELARKFKEAQDGPFDKLRARQRV